MNTEERVQRLKRKIDEYKKINLWEGASVEFTHDQVAAVGPDQRFRAVDTRDFPAEYSYFLKHVGVGTLSSRRPGFERYHIFTIDLLFSWRDPDYGLWSSCSPKKVWGKDHEFLGVSDEVVGKSVWLVGHDANLNYYGYKMVKDSPEFIISHGYESASLISHIERQVEEFEPDYRRLLRAL